MKEYCWIDLRQRGQLGQQHWFDFDFCKAMMMMMKFVEMEKNVDFDVDYKRGFD